MGHIEGISAGVLFGWVCALPGKTADLEVFIDGTAVGCFEASIERNDIVQDADHQTAKGFFIDLSDRLTDGEDARIEVVERTGGATLVGSPLSTERNFATGVIDAVVGANISGWVVIGSSEPAVAALEMWVDGELACYFKATQLRTDLRRIGIARTRCGFQCQLPEKFWDGQTHAVQIRVQGTDCTLREGSFNIVVAPDGNQEPLPPTAFELSMPIIAPDQGPELDKQLALLSAGDSQFMLHILHGWGGGTQSHVLDISERLRRQGTNSLLLRPDASGALTLMNPGNGQTVTLGDPTEIPTLATHLEKLGVWHIHFHHTIGLPQTIWTLPDLLGVAFDVTAHDYYFACPRVNLLDADGTFCGQPPIEACERCVKAAPPLQALIATALESAGGTVAAWRGLHAEQLERARHLFAPSQDTAKRFGLIFPSAPIEFQPHPEPAYGETSVCVQPPKKTLRVVLIGHLAPNKGHQLLLELARFSQAKHLPLRFVIAGDTCDNDAYADLLNVDILGAYRPSELPDLLALANCKVALFLSNWPETYSYTLSEAWRCHLLPVVPQLGAQAERVAANGQGIVLSLQPQPQELAKVLMQVHRYGFHADQALLNKVDSKPESELNLLHDYYQIAKSD